MTASRMIYQNLLTPALVSSITHTAALGSITALTPIEKVLNRSILNSYKFTYTGIGLKTFTLDLNEDISFNSLAILGLNSGATIQSVRAYNGNVLLSDSTQISEQLKIFHNEVYTNFVLTMDSSFINCDKVEIIYSDVDLIAGRISAVYAGTSFGFDVKPTSMRYGALTQGTKQRTEGGQVVASQNQTLLTASFTSVATPEVSVISNYFNFNSIASVSEPIIFIPIEGEEIMLYGTQSRANTSSVILGRDAETSQWLYETSFNIEEEL